MIVRKTRPMTIIIEMTDIAIYSLHVHFHWRYKKFKKQLLYLGPTKAHLAKQLCRL